MINRPKMKRPLPISQLLGDFIKESPLAQRLREGDIWKVWNKAVGEQVAQRAQPVAFRNGTLTVIVDSGPWMQQLSFLKQQLIDGINKELGEALVQEIYLKAGKPQPAKIPAAKKPLRDLTSEDEAFIAEQAGAVANEELQQTIKSLLSCHLRHKS